MRTIEQNRIHVKNSRLKSREFVRELKTKPCANCHVQYPYYVMQFDHVFGQKSFQFANLAAAYKSKEKILEEAAKCEVVCANCHAIRTWTRKNP